MSHGVFRADVAASPGLSLVGAAARAWFPSPAKDFEEDWIDLDRFLVAMAPSRGRASRREPATTGIFRIEEGDEVR